jgi:hypothetical protein
LRYDLQRWLREEMVLMRSAAFLAWLTLAIAPACSGASAVQAPADKANNPAMACTVFGQHESMNNGLDVDNHCPSNVNIMIAVYGKGGYYLLNTWHHIQPESSAITGIPEDPDDDEYYVHRDEYGFTEYYIACLDKDRKCNAAMDCVRAKGNDVGGVFKIADAPAVAENCRTSLLGGASQ